MLNVFTQHGARVAADQFVLQYPGDRS
jgi:hypothetical protein